MLYRKSVLAAKLETTIGTDVTPGASDATFNAYNAVMNPEPEMEEREGQGGFDMLSQINGARKARVTFRTNLQWDGSATEPSWADTFFPACGWVKSGQVYSPVSLPTGTSSSDPRSLTISHYVDGALRKMTGCVGTFKVTLPTGKLGYIEWDFMGVWAGETDVSIISPTYVTDLNYRFSSGACTWNSVALLPSTTTIDAGNVITMREDPSKSSGYLAGIVTSRYPKVTLDAEKVLVATQDRDGAWLAGTENALALHCGGVGNSLLKFDAAKAQIIKIGYGDREKLTVDNLEFACNKNGATHDQCLQITFTAAT
jgi:hypothetical protein